MNKKEIIKYKKEVFMKRFVINSKLRNRIKNNSNSFDKISQKLGFNIKNIYYRNISINEDYLNKLKSFLNFNSNLKEITFNNTKNLGKYTISPPIKQIKKDKYLAEFIGIMLGDGNIHQNSIRIAFDKRNKTYINYVKELFKKIFNTYPKQRIFTGKNLAFLYYYNKNLVEKLIELGLKRGNKIKTQIGIPHWIKENKNYSKACIKGLIDTDGCIYFCKRDKQTYVKFTNYNQELLNDFKETTKNLGYSFAKANRFNACLYRKKEVVKFLNTINPIKYNGVIV